MLTALGNFLGNIVVPLTAMGQAMQMNASTYAAQQGMGGLTMSTVAFNIFAGPWIQYLGGLAIGAGNFLTSLVNFLQGIVDLL
jgi:hypothetical protein